MGPDTIGGGGRRTRAARSPGAPTSRVSPVTPGNPDPPDAVALGMTSETSALPPALLDDAARGVLFADAHTAYGFDDATVDLDQVRRAYDDARWAPTAFNAQPLRIAAVTSPEARERLVPHMTANNKERTAAAPLVLIQAYDPRWHEHMPVLMPAAPQLRDRFEGQPEMRESTGRDNALLQAGYLILSLRAHGLHVGPMTGFDAAGVREDFLAEQGWEPLIVMNVGHAAAPDAEGAVRPRGGRFEFEDVLEVR